MEDYWYYNPEPETLLRHNVKMCRFESNSAGGRIADRVQSEVKRLGGVTHITKKYTTSNKDTRIIVNSSWVKEHCLFRNAECYARDSDYAVMLQLLCTYTMMGRNANDDVPDGLAMFAEYMQSFKLGKVEVFQRPW